MKTFSIPRKRTKTKRVSRFFELVVDHLVHELDFTDDKAREMLNDARLSGFAINQNKPFEFAKKLAEADNE